MSEVINWPGRKSSPSNTNVGAEAALIGALLIDCTLYHIIDGLVAETDFFIPVHGRIFAKIGETVRQGGAVTPVTLIPHFEGDPGLKSLGGASYLARLTADGQGLLAPRELAAQIAELRMWRRLDDARRDPSRSLASIADDLSAFSAGAFGAASLPAINLAGPIERPALRQFIWGDWLPLRQTTMLSGDGGVGKSLLSQQLATCVAAGRFFLGRPTMAGPTLYLTVEDDVDELMRRQFAICDALGIDFADLAGRLHLVSLAGEDNAALAQFAPDGRMAATDRWRGVQSLTRAAGLRLAIFDNATDLMAGDHNDLHQVARFVNLLTGWAIANNGAALILHHPNKGGADWLGSIAWHNKVRNRLIIKRDDDEPDPDCRMIEAPKANYSQSGSKARFRWHAGAFVQDDELPETVRAQLDDISGANAANAAFLACLAVCTEQRRNVSHMRSSNYAPRVFVRMPEGKGFTVDQHDAALERLLHLGVIEIDAELWTDAHRHPKRGIRLKPGSA